MNDKLKENLRSKSDYVLNKDFKNYYDRILNTDVYSYTLKNDDTKKINIGASPESLFNMYNQNTSFIKKSLSRTGDDVKKLHSDPYCELCTEDSYCGICRNKLFQIDYKTMFWYLVLGIQDYNQNYYLPLLQRVQELENKSK